MLGLLTNYLVPLYVCCCLDEDLVVACHPTRYIRTQGEIYYKEVSCTSCLWPGCYQLQSKDYLHAVGCGEGP